MKAFILSAAVLVSASMPVAAGAAPVVQSKQSVCERVIVVLEDGTQVPGMLCYMNGGRT